ncbi:hypothetical protein U6B65_04840 [Oscillospiraceae bacterium MB08-C2-2]|nr:hypothetical protein U6B65_04840 [Oscillospiraceae bacterium MB08-C2-2]
MFNNNTMIEKLEAALAQKLRALNHYVSEANRFNVSIRQNELFEKKQSVVFIFKITSKYGFLEFCCPLTGEQRKRLDEAGYVPHLRCDKYLKVGTEECMDRPYAYANIQFPLGSSALDFMTALEYLHKELELFLAALDLEKL